MRLFLLATFLFFSISITAQRYSEVKVFFDDDHSIKDLALLGVEVDHGEYRPGAYITNVFSDREIQLIHEKGFQIEVLIDDMAADFLARNKEFQNVSERNLACEENGVTEYEMPINYSFGSMGGYHTYQEMLDQLDSMASFYPNIFKAKEPITTAYTTHEGRPIYWVKISDNPNIDENEPEALYTALHHAREPNSLSQMIFYLWYLLENYETSEEVKYLVDNVEMYFVPCINPDGYAYNETTNPNGGGLWRKNRRDNGDGTFGVDLNRNYPFQWGFNNDGSSPNPADETYRGPSPGSEPEVQMIMEFCNAHNFRIALNYHTHGNILIYPWGYIDGPSPDDGTFKGFAAAMVDENKFLAGYGSETLGYTVNGDSDDWMYGEQDSKEKIFSMTPEVGSAFWPSQNQIDGLNKTTTKMNLIAAHLLLNYGLVTPHGDLLIDNLNGELSYSIRKLGLKPGTLSVTLQPVSDNVLSIGSSDNFGLFNLEETSGSINYTLKPEIGQGEIVDFNLIIDNGEYQWEIPIHRIYSTQMETTIFDSADNLDNWSVSDPWSLTNEDFVSAPTSITDSPGTFTANNEFSQITMKQPVQLVNAEAAFLSFHAKWDIENNYDFVQVLLTVDSDPPVPLCGKYTNNGVSPQPLDQPLYDGIQDEWVLEEIDLTEYLPMDGNAELTISFLLFTDQYVTGDGFYFDDLKITEVERYISSSHVIDPSMLRMTSRPNPANGFVYIDIEGEMGNATDYNLLVFNTLGQSIHSEKVKDRGIIKLETNLWNNGIYLFHLTDGKRKTQIGKIVISK